MSSEPCFESLETRTLLSVFTANVNFQPKRSPAPPGYLVDSGVVFKSRGGPYAYGWTSKNSASAVDRNSKRSPDQRYDTFNTLNFGRTFPNWEIAVPTGKYQVRIVAGDPLDTSAYYRIRAESTTVINGRANVRKRWKDSTVIVEVTDGRLTISALKGAIRNKINFIEIVGLTDAADKLEAETADLFSGTTVNGASVNSLDNGDYLQFKNVLFESQYQSIFASIAVNRGDAGGTIELHVDAVDGPLLGALKTQTTGGSAAFVTQHADIDDVPLGIHDVFVVFKGSRQIGSIDWLHFDTRPLTWIMPVGDSITEGSGGHASYRAELWHKLEDAGHAVDFVGTRTGVRSGTGDPPVWDWDMQYQAQFGWQAGQVRDSISGPMGSEMPDVVLLNIGINDLFMGQSTESTANEIGQIIDRLRSKNPNVTVLVALLGPTDRVSNSTLMEMNSLITGVAQSKSTSSSVIKTVDLFTGFNHETHTYDGTHPNAAGEALQAQRWFDALQTVLPPVPADNPHDHH